MSKYIKPGEFVDGKKCAVVTRKYDFKGPHRDPLTNSIMMLYELSRNCSVEVTQEHDDDIERITGVHYIVGDIIEAEAIQMWVDTKRDNVGFVVKEGVTATHGAKLADTKKSRKRRNANAMSMRTCRVIITIQPRKAVAYPLLLTWP